ncbi:hypothetical protein ACFCXF_27015 [Streptomyces virginiae]|uniref:hypothetical protein n=1 Tax=Streptomyces virginiae TaxID=1961 RepID=UPI0035D74F2D
MAAARDQIVDGIGFGGVADPFPVRGERRHGVAVRVEDRRVVAPALDREVVQHWAGAASRTSRASMMSRDRGVGPDDGAGDARDVVELDVAQENVGDGRFVGGAGVRDVGASGRIRFAPAEAWIRSNVVPRLASGPATTST